MTRQPGRRRGSKGCAEGGSAHGGPAAGLAVYPASLYCTAAPAFKSRRPQTDQPENRGGQKWPPNLGRTPRRCAFCRPILNCHYRSTSPQPRPYGNAGSLPAMAARLSSSVLRARLTVAPDVLRSDSPMRLPRPAQSSSRSKRTRLTPRLTTAPAWLLMLIGRRSLRLAGPFIGTLARRSRPTPPTPSLLPRLLTVRCCGSLSGASSRQPANLIVGSDTEPRRTSGAALLLSAHGA